ncbi:hypothetical protein ABZ454_34445 [Streptomyces sp. NPDC005803]|uniref:hypothetical protein n=1 Tax=Streptomyces sp. NPDC005803 TaxID=3154297 RepID=UPI00341177F5
MTPSTTYAPEGLSSPTTALRKSKWGSGRSSGYRVQFLIAHASPLRHPSRQVPFTSVEL